MYVKVRDIGNSKGIILPKHILAQCNIVEDVTIEVKNHHIEIAAVATNPRKGWADEFKKMAVAGDDTLLIPDIFNDENMEGWIW